MGESFACPECGVGIAVRGLSPGREVICPACATLVEVPYLPRATKRPKRRDAFLPGKGGRGSRRGRLSLSQQRQLRWGLALGSVLVVALATWWAVGSIGVKARSDRERVLGELIAASDEAQRVGNPGAAFREIEAAVLQARKIDPDGSTRLDALVERRDRAAIAEVEARLTALDKLGLEQRVGEAETLVARVERDQALAPLADAVGARAEAATLRLAEANGDLARQALQAARPIEAFQAAARSHARADRLASRPDAARIQAEARAVIVAAVERFGVTTLSTATTPGTAPKAGSIDDFVTPIWTEALATRGYLLLPSGSPWGEVWVAHAPYQAETKVTESRDDLYLQSQNHATRIDAQFTLTRGGKPHWQTRVFAQTRSPLPDLPAFLASRLATASHRDPEIERRLRDDARTAFRIQADRIFRGIPAANPAPLAGSTSRPASTPSS